MDTISLGKGSKEKLGEIEKRERGGRRGRCWRMKSDL